MSVYLVIINVKRITSYFHTYFYVHIDSTIFLRNLFLCVYFTLHRLSPLLWQEKSDRNKIADFVTDYTDTQV